MISLDCSQGLIFGNEFLCGVSKNRLFLGGILALTFLFAQDNAFAGRKAKVKPKAKIQLTTKGHRTFGSGVNETSKLTMHVKKSVGREAKARLDKLNFRLAELNLKLIHVESSSPVNSAFLEGKATNLDGKRMGLKLSDQSSTELRLDIDSSKLESANAAVSKLGLANDFQTGELGVYIDGDFQLKINIDVEREGLVGTGF